MIEFWACALALSLLLYVLLDGFDLGVGMLFAFAPDETARRHMMRSISPVWDGNETWLVVSAAILFGAFPLAYSVVLPALYIPLILMLLALILRGVAFEFRYKTRHLRWVWDIGFCGGSFVAAFVQGATVGALVQELPMQGGQYVGGPFHWATPFTALCGLGLVVGYALLGASWLTFKTEADVRELGYRYLPKLMFGALVFLTAALAMSLWKELRVLDRWLERPLMAVLPVIGAAAGAGLVYAVKRRVDWLSFPLAALVFITAFATLAASFLPYMVPFSITIAQAAAPHSSLSFLFWGAGVFVLPLTLVYTVVVYRVFKGKIDVDAGYH